MGTSWHGTGVLSNTEATLRAPTRPAETPGPCQVGGGGARRAGVWTRGEGGLGEGRLEGSIIIILEGPARKPEARAGAAENSFGRSLSLARSSCSLLFFFWPFSLPLCVPLSLSLSPLLPSPFPLLCFYSSLLFLSRLRRRCCGIRTSLR